MQTAGIAVRMWSAEGVHKGCAHCLKTTEKLEIE